MGGSRPGEIKEVINVVSIPQQKEKVEMVLVGGGGCKRIPEPQNVNNGGDICQTHICRCFMP